MRKLILLQGPSASGKSEWIKKHDLTPYVVSADKIREQLGYRSETTIDNNVVPIMDDQQEKPVWDIFKQMLEKRLQNGVTTVVDNTNTNFMNLKLLRKLAKKYYYEVTTIDFMTELLPKVSTKLAGFEYVPDISIENLNEATHTLLKRNDNRDQYRVSDIIIRRQVEQYKALWERINQHPDDWKWLNQITPNSRQIKQLLWHDKSIDLSKYKKIQVIGDIHNDFSALMKVFDEHEKGTAYIFLGDYLDKGTRPYSTFEFLAEELGGDNLYFLRGNHEDFWQKYITEGKVSQQFEKSLDVLLSQYSEKELKRRMDYLLWQMHDYMFFTYYGQKFVASHAGLEQQMLPKRLNLMPSKAVTYGLSNGFNTHNPYGRDIDTIWSKVGTDVYNLHGHRNNFNRYVVGNSINLNYEGQFRWLTIYPNKIVPHKIKSIDAPSFEEALCEDPDIFTLKQKDNIVSYNFSRDAFIKQKWNQHTSNARGLFIRQDDHQIVGRGFPKFFEVGQTPEAKIENLTFPVSVMRKHDGFLTIACYDKKTHRIHIYSKRGETDMAELAKEDLTKTGYMDKIVKYYEDKSLRDTTLLFETVDPFNDMHIVKYNNLHIYPIAIIDNTRQGTWLNVKLGKYENNKTLHDWVETEINSQSWIATVDQIDYTVTAKCDAIEKLKRVIKNDRDLNPHREGIVLYGQNMMLKVKYPFYHKAREMRLQLEFYERHGSLNNKWQFGARDWTRFCVAVKEFKYAPILPLMVEEFDTEYNIHDLLRDIYKDKDYIDTVKLNETRQLWQDFKVNYVAK